MDVARRMEHRYDVRFDEADADGQLRPSGFLRFAQDMAWRHSELAGFGREWYGERGLAWLVRDVRLVIAGRVTYADVLSATTEVVGWRHVWARRHSELRRLGSATRIAAGLDGSLVAVVDTDWVLLDECGRPARVPTEITALFGAERRFERSRHVLPPTPANATHLATRVRPLDVDPMGHMNNAAYLDVVDEVLSLLPWTSRPTGPVSDGAAPEPPAGTSAAAGGLYRIGYVRPALPGSPLDVACWRSDDEAVACRISDDRGDELTSVLISRAPSPR